MAISESIRSELDAVFDARIETECFYKSLELIGSGSDYAMVYSFRRQVERWASACDALEKTLRQRALPLVEDFEGATK